MYCEDFLLIYFKFILLKILLQMYSFTYIVEVLFYRGRKTNFIFKTMFHQKRYEILSANPVVFPAAKSNVIGFKFLEATNLNVRYATKVA